MGSPRLAPALARIIVLLAAVLSAIAPLGAQAQIPGLTPTQSAPEGEEAGGRTALENLLEVLRDDQARAALIEELEQAVGQDPQQEGAPAGAGEGEATSGEVTPSAELRSIGGQITEFTREAVQGAARSVSQLWIQLSNTPRILSGLSAVEVSALLDMARHLAILVLLTYGGFLLLRALQARARRRLQRSFHTGGWIAKPAALLFELVLDIVAVVIPYAVGHALAVSMLGTPGEIALDHALYLNAFVVVEVVMAIIRTIVAPYQPEQRLVNLNGVQSQVVMVWSRLLIGLFVYSQIMLFPLVTETISYIAGRSISLVLLLVWLALIAVAILRARGFVSHRLARMSGHTDAGGGLVRHWHVAALGYVLVLLVVALTRPVAHFQSFLWNNAQIAIALLAGAIALNIIKRILAGGISLPPRLARRAPQLESQLAALVPAILKVLRIVVVGAVIVFCLHKLGLFNFIQFMESEFGARVTGSAITIVLILLFSALIWLVVNAWVEANINPELSPNASARKRTLFVLLRNALTIALIVITLMFILSEIGINIAPLIASAGVIGLAIGFGAQKLVQDIITGIFIQLEGAIDVGDVVSIGGISGVVERLTIRSASLRDVEGSYHIIPFSSVDTVTNFMRGFSYALFDMRVAYRENTEEAKQAMFDAFAELRADPEHQRSIIDDFEWLGVDAFGASEVVLRARIKTLPGKQWGIKRAYNAIVKRIFDERDIEIPFPHQTLYFGADKSGKAPPLHMVREESSGPGRQSPAAKARPAPAKRTRRGKSPDPDLPDVDAGPESDR